jgi:peptidoglycan/LPS O-acetylase OafA/YrhL
MELIAAVFIAGSLGFFVTPRKRALVAYLVLWAVIFPIQTIVVFSEDGSDNNLFYWILNTLILCAGIGLNRLGAVLGERRRARAGASQVEARSSSTAAR